jgi:hypothetical protein
MEPEIDNTEQTGIPPGQKHGNSRNKIIKQKQMKIINL